MQYDPRLDGIRALAALTVAATHAHMPGLTGGFFGVDIFFVLSGYLITCLLLAERERTGTLDWWGFMRRRFLRLWPAMTVFLVAYLAMAPWLWPGTPWLKHAQDAVLASLYLVNWAPNWGEYLSVLGHVWSLAVEMQFYVVWPLLFWGLLTWSRRTLMPVLGLLYVMATAWRWWGGDHLPDVWDVYIRTDMHCSGLILGSLIGVWNPRTAEAWTLPAVLVLAVAMTFFSSAWLPTVRYGFTVAELGAALLLIARPGWLAWPWLVWVGRLSYGLYLWHYLIMHKLTQGSESDWRVTLFCGVVGGLALAWLSQRWVERRFHEPVFVRRPAVLV